MEETIPSIIGAKITAVIQDGSTILGIEIETTEGKWMSLYPDVYKKWVIQTRVRCEDKSR